MIVSRGLTLMRLSSHLVKSNLLQSSKHNLAKLIKRDGHGGEYYYRRAPEPTRAAERYAEVLGGIVWWWLIWHFLTDYHELISGSPYPDPASWTDEELGIPPEDED